MRIGFGMDVHKLTIGRPLILGGVNIPFELGLDGHSDADVLSHAITDAILGAAALGDIGGMFPDTDDKYLNADSLKLMEEAAEELRKNNFFVNNVDTTVAAQNPKFSPYISEMRRNVAKALGISVSCVSVKATTTERLGFEGRGEGISAYAVCTVCEKI